MPTFAVRKTNDECKKIHGGKAHSYYMGQDTFKKLQGTNKGMITVAGATHTDLYDQVDKIPFNAIQKFFNNYLR